MRRADPKNAVRRKTHDPLSILLLLATMLWASTASAQTPPPYTIGFADTLLFSDSLHYAGFGYEGPAPLFVQAWFPIEEPATIRLRYRQLRHRTLSGPLRRVYDELQLRADSAFIEYDLRYAFNSDSVIRYAPFTEQQVKDSLYALPSRAFGAPWPARSDRPVIVYHHGSGGFSDENVRMAEEFAANGFVFLACNFHWPMANKSYGYPLTWEPDRSSIRTMLRFARQLAHGSKVFYIGHSWGAQEGWCTLHEPGLADAFVSLETTMEWKTDTAEVRDKWPHVLEAITTHRYPMPIQMVADSDGEPPYPLFQGVRANIRYLDPREPFAHESYTSAYLLRLEAGEWVHMPDEKLLHEQEDLYRALLDELLAFLNGSSAAPMSPAGDPFHRR